MASPRLPVDPVALSFLRTTVHRHAPDDRAVAFVQRSRSSNRSGVSPHPRCPDPRPSWTYGREIIARARRRTPLRRARRDASHGENARSLPGPSKRTGRDVPALRWRAHPAMGQVPRATSSPVPRVRSHVQRPDGHPARVPEATRLLGRLLRLPHPRHQRSSYRPAARNPQGHRVPLAAPSPGRAPGGRTRAVTGRRRH